MRTKHLLTAIVLPSLFAACTADELVKTDNGAAEDLSKRPVVEGVTFNLGGADTKAIVPEGGNYNTIQFESTDKIGALLVDKLKDARQTDPINRYELLTTEFNSNYQFNNVGGASFASEAYLVEGNYVFYFPYNGQRTRGQLNTNLPIKQKLAKDANGNWSTFPDVLAQSIESGAPLALGYDFVKATDENKSANMTLKQIYAVPAITVKNAHTVKDKDGNNVAAPVKIQEIVLKNTTGSGFVVKAPLKFADATNKTAWDVADKTYANNNIVRVLFNEDIPSGKTNTHAKGVWTEAKISDAAGKGRYTSDVTGTALLTDGTSETITITLDEPVEVAAEGDFTFYAVIPAEAYALNKLEVTVIDENGLSCTAIQLGKASLYQGKRYPVEEYTNGNVNTDIAGTTLSGYMAGFSAGAGVRVSTVDELLNAIKNFKVVSANTECKIRLAGEAVINQRVAQFLNALSSSITAAETITFVNGATISDAAAVNLAPTMNVTFSEGVTVKAGTSATISNAKVILPRDKSMEIEEGATVTLKTNGFVTNSEIVNAGTLNVEDTVLSDVYNYGVMNATKTSSIAALENGDPLYMNVAATLNVSAEKTLTIGGVSTNAVGATINNQGTLTAGNLTNNGTIVNGGEENSAAVATISSNTSINRQPVATIENYADLTVTTNDAVINMASVNGVATVSAGSANGVVNNDVLANVDVTGSNLVKYTMTGNQTTIPGYLTGNGINTLVLKNAVLNLSVDAAIGYKTTVGALNVIVEGNTTIMGTTGAGLTKQVVEMTADKKLTVAENAKLTIMASAKLASGTTGYDIVILNKGKVVNNGEVEDVRSLSTVGTGAWSGNAWVMYTVTPDGDFAINVDGAYEINANNYNITGVTSKGYLRSSLARTVKMTKAVCDGSTGKVIVEGTVTLVVSNDDTTDVSSAPADGSGVNVDNVKAGLTGLSNIIVNGGKMQVTRKITYTGSGTVAKQVTVETTDGTTWTCVGYDDPA